jgi:hypothetical protein
VPRRRQPHLQARRAVDQRVPPTKGQGHDALAQRAEHAADQPGVTREADLQRVFDDHRQQQRRGLAAHDRPREPGRQQVGDAADMVDVHMGHHQRPHAVERKADLQPLRPGTVGRRLGTLEQPAIDQHRLAVGEFQLVAGAGDAAGGAVVDPSLAHTSLASPALAGQMAPCDTRGKLSGLRMDSTDRSTSSCGQYKWSSVGRCTSESCSIVAFLNHGKSVKGTASSSSPSSSQKQCVETLVTSAPKVTVPCILDLLDVSFDDCLSLTYLYAR